MCVCDDRWMCRFRVLPALKESGKRIAGAAYFGRKQDRVWHAMPCILPRPAKLVSSCAAP